jgi:AcrR family transcriptional regulator
MTTKDRILEAAAKLFYRDGVRAVGVDAIAGKAGVTKRTLYYHFRSKDDLIAAWLEGRDQPNLASFKRWFAEAEGSAAQRIEAVFRQLAQMARHPKWKGCGFLRTSAELVEFPGHPAIVAGRAHKRNVEDWLCEVAGDRLIARQIMLLMDGAFSVVLLHRDPSYLEAAGAAAAKLLAPPISAEPDPNGADAPRR